MSLDQVAPLLEFPLTRERVRAIVCELLDAEVGSIEDDDDLFDMGIDSVRIVHLANCLANAGVDLAFAELAVAPTISGLWHLLESNGLGNAHGPTASPALTVVRTGADGPHFDLTPVQHAYWIGRRPDQVLGGVACHGYFEFTSGDGCPPLDARRLERAIRALVARHEMLRSRFTDDGHQQILANSPWGGLTVRDFSGFTENARGRELEFLRQKLSHRVLDVASGHVFDFQLSILTNGQTRLHFNIDLLVSDVMSIRIMLHDLAQLYSREDVSLPPFTYGFREYLAARAAQRPEVRDRARVYWESRLAELPGGPELPLAVEPASVECVRFVRRQCRLPRAQRLELERTARTHGLTPAMVFLTAYAQVLAMWSAQQRFLLNVPLFDRHPLHPDVSRLVADFTSVILLEVDVSDEASFLTHARRIQAQFRSDVGHSAFSGVEVLRRLGRLRGGERSGAPVVFASNIGDELIGEEFRNAFGEMTCMRSQTPQVWLDHQIYESDGGLLLSWDAVEELFPAGVLDAMFQAYQDLLGWLCKFNTGWNGGLPQLLPKPQAQMRASVRRDSGVPADRLLHGAFFERADREPERIALRWGVSGSATYHELAERALRVASWLLGRGLESGDAVAVVLPKGPDQVVAVLGVLAAGGTYVPIGVQQPVSRRSKMLEQANVRFVVDDLTPANAFAPLPLPREVPTTASAYVIFTSGSTGTPKGVEVSHRSAANTIDDINERCSVSARDSVLALSALDFDLSVYDLFGLLTVGGTVVLVSEEDRRNAYQWLELAHLHAISIWNTVPTLFEMLLVAADDVRARGPGVAVVDNTSRGLPKSLRIALLSGEWVGIVLPSRWRALHPTCRLIALGGATEASIWSNAFEVEDVPAGWRSIPYGFPLSHQAYRVVDARGRDCPDWVPGELWIGGAGIARGYRGDAEKTVAKFVEFDGSRWYKTGDLGRYRPDGMLEFLGRIDHQVKIRGHRIELGEVEHALQAYPGVTSAVVVAIGEPRERRMIAALAVDPNYQVTDASFGTEQLRSWLLQRLPDYMVPDQFVALRQLPETTNGKLDRAAIAWLGGESRSACNRAFEAPANAQERMIAAAWSEMLGVESVSRRDSFFELGGDSLAATRLVARLRAQGMTGVDLAGLFSAPILEDFAALTEIDSAPELSVQLRSEPEARYKSFALTEVQRAYRLGQQQGLPLGGVSAHYYTEFEGADVDLRRFEQAWNRLVVRHEMLRAIIESDEEQRILPQVPEYRIELVELGAEAPKEAVRHALASLRDELSHLTLDCSQWPVFAIKAVHYGENRTRIGMNLDSMIIDAQSMMILLSELNRAYCDPGATLPELNASFRDYVTQIVPSETAVTAARSYWRQRLDTLPPAPRLPLLRDPASLTGSAVRFTRREARLASNQWQQLKEKARAVGVTPSSVLLACYCEVLGVWSGHQNVTVTLTLSDRRNVHPDIHRVLGDFTQLALAAYERSACTRWDEIVRRVQGQQWRDLDHGAASGLWVLREHARRSGGPIAAFPVVFTSALGLSGELSLDVTPPFPERTWSLTETPQVWLDNKVYESQGGLAFDWDSVDDLFPHGMLDAAFGAYCRLLTWVVESDWATPPPTLLPEAQAAVRMQVNDTAAPYRSRTLAADFFETAARSPGEVALIDSDRTLTYGELARRALQLGAALHCQGVGPGDAVAISLPRGADQVIATLGVMAAGCAYVPVGIDQPPTRRSQIYQSAAVRAVVTSPEAPLSSAFSGLPSIVITEVGSETPLEGPTHVDSGSIAYVIFTSGSTGEPKGVEVTHEAALNTIDDINSRFEVGPDDRVLAVSALDFDLSVYDTFGILSAGGALVLVDEESRRDPYRWLELMEKHGVTLWNSVPMLMEMLLVAAEDDRGLQGLRLVLLSGDWVGLDLADRIRTFRPECRVVALGGATEASIWSNAYEVDRVDPEWRSVPYGYPLRNQVFRVVDERGRDCPDWVLGELWIGGRGVAEGYRGDEQRTAAKFVSSEGQRWYRTGDVGRYWPDGKLEFLGRSDHQVKIRGHRIELGEVEQALLSHEAVRNAAVVTTGARGNMKLAALVVLEPQARAKADALMEHLKGRLPVYALPGELHFIDALPLTSNGKVDRAALQAIASSRSETATEDKRAPRDGLEQMVARLWEDLLAREDIGRDDDFFALGGDSLKASRLVARLREMNVTGAELAGLFVRPTLKDFAATLALANGSSVDPSNEAVRAIVPDPSHRFDPFPLTEVQQAYWVGRQPTMPLGGVGAHYYCEFDDVFGDIERLQAAWNLLVERHDVLRLVIDESGLQRVLEHVPKYEIGVVRVGSTEPEVLAEAFAAVRSSMSHQVLDPAQWPVFDIRAVQGAAGRTRVAISLDNLSLDGFSIMRLFEELDRLYRDLDTRLPALTSVSFRDFVVQSQPDPRRLERARAYWLSRLPTLPPAPQLPLAVDQNAIVAPRFSRRQATIEPARWQDIKRKARSYGITPSAALLAAYAEILGRWSEQRALTLSLTLFDRRDAQPAIERVLGDFTSLLLLAYDPRPDKSWLGSARRLQEQLWRDLDHREASGVWVQRQHAGMVNAGANFPVVFTSVIGLAEEVTDTLPWPTWSISQTPQVWLDHQVIERKGGAILTWDAVEELFPEGLLDAAFAEYESVLRWLADSEWTGAWPLSTSNRHSAKTATARAQSSPAVKESPDASPQNDVELALARTWCSLLGVPRVGRSQSFFALGGDSLLATRLVQTLKRRFGVQVSLRAFFMAPTIADLARAIASAEGPCRSAGGHQTVSIADHEMTEEGIL